MIWVTSDQHFNHDKIIQYANRPFNNVREMNRAIIERHNSRVKTGDTVYVLGDFRLTTNGPTKWELEQALNGKLVFIQGNHDKQNGQRGLSYAVMQSHGLNILLTHKPVDILRINELHQRIDENNRSINLVLVGHVHNLWTFRDYMVNCCVDVWDFYPIHLKQILKARETWLRSWKGDNAYDITSQCVGSLYN